MPSLINLLKDVDVQAISLVPGGANGQRIFLFKCDGFECSTTTTLGEGRIVKADGDDWSSFYIVVAEPGTEEKPGLNGDPSTRDVWADEDEIRKAAHRFMKNGGLINKLHQDMEPYGDLVENAIAHQDFTVDGHMIRKGSWYIAVEPTEEGRRLVNSGELGGVSIQGLGIREPMAKDAALVPNKPGVTNWVERAGGLPKYIADIAGDLISERGKSTGNAIQLAVGIVQRWCRGQGNVSAATRGKACAALAEWEAKRAAAHVQKEEPNAYHALAKLSATAVIVDDDTWLWANSEMLSKMEGQEQTLGWLQRIAKTLGIESEVDDSAYAELVKRTFSEEERRNAKYSMKGNKYPIDNCGDVKAAVSSIGRGNADPSAIKAHIIRAAKGLGCVGSLPDSWNVQKGSLEDGGTVQTTTQEDDVDLADRIDEIEKTQKEQGTKLDALTAEDSPIMKGIQDLRIKFDEREHKSDDEDDKSKDGESKSSEEKLTKSEGEKLRDQLETVAEDQGKIAEALLKINAKVEASLSGSSSQRDEHEREPVAKSNGSPLSGLLS